MKKTNLKLRVNQKIILKRILNTNIRGCGLDSPDSGQGHVAGSGEYGNELSQEGLCSTE
jgi:hypothetical protein